MQLLKRILKYFHPKMPALLVQKLASYNYDPDEFLTWYCKFEEFEYRTKQTAKIKSLKSRFYTFSAYYVWVIFVAAGLVVATYSPLYGIVTVIFSPIILAGTLYVMSYTQKFLTPRKKKKIINKSSKNTNK